MQNHWFNCYRQILRINYPKTNWEPQFYLLVYSYPDLFFFKFQRIEKEKSCGLIGNYLSFQKPREREKNHCRIEKNS